MVTDDALEERLDDMKQVLDLDPLIMMAIAEKLTSYGEEAT